MSNQWTWIFKQVRYVARDVVTLENHVKQGSKFECVPTVVRARLSWSSGKTFAISFWREWGKFCQEVNRKCWVNHAQLRRHLMSKDLWPAADLNGLILFETIAGWKHNEFARTSRFANGRALLWLKNILLLLIQIFLLAKESHRPSNANAGQLYILTNLNSLNKWVLANKGLNTNSVSSSNHKWFPVFEVVFILISQDLFF